MKILKILLFIGMALSASANMPERQNHKVENHRNGKYKKKKHWFKKLIMGKRYCDCPKTK